MSKKAAGEYQAKTKAVIIIYYRASLAKSWKIIAKRFDNHSVVFISGGYKNRR